MKANDSNFVTGLRGYQAIAEYQGSPLIDFKGNPLIEALPPILTENEVIRRIRYRPHFCESERELEPSLRMHCVQRLVDFVEPLPIHLEVEQMLSRMIRHGYKARNPFNQEYVKLLRQKNLLETERPPLIKSTASSFAFIGISGIGKSTTIDRLLTMYPQVIVHNRYLNRNLSLYQLVWLKLECPHDGSLRSLCLDFFQAVDERLGSNHYRGNQLERKIR